MNRVLGFSIAFSAGIHAVVLLGMPESLALRNLGLGGPAPSERGPMVHYLPPLRVHFPEPQPEVECEPPRLPPVTVGLEEDKEPEDLPEGSGQGEASGLHMPPIQLPGDLDPEPERPRPLPLPKGDLALPVIPAPPKPPGRDVRIEDVIWNRKVAQRIGRPFLPAALAGRKLHGTVRLLLLLTPDGRIRDLRVRDPGTLDDILVMAAKAQVRASAPFPPSPEGMDPCFLRIPVSFRY